MISALVRKIKRVSDVNAMGYSPNSYNAGSQRGPNLYPNLETDPSYLHPGIIFSY